VHPTSALRSRGGGGLPVSAVECPGLRSSVFGAGAGGRSMDGHPWSGLAERFDGGVERMRPSGRARAAPPAPSTRIGRDGSPQAARGTSPVPSSEGAGGRATSMQEPGLRSRFRCGHPVTRSDPSIGVIARRRPSCHRTPTVPPVDGPPGLDLRTSRQPTRRSSGSGRRFSPESSGRRSATLGWQVGPARQVGRRADHRDLVPGSELFRVGALEGRRTSREGARVVTGRRRPDPHASRCRIVGP
jgi:hypothetical protein